MGVERSGGPGGSDGGECLDDVEGLVESGVGGVGGVVRREWGGHVVGVGGSGRRGGLVLLEDLAVEFDGAESSRCSNVASGGGTSDGGSSESGAEQSLLSECLDVLLRPGGGRGWLA